MFNQPLAVPRPRRHEAAHAREPRHPGIRGQLDRLWDGFVTAAPALGAYAALRLTGLLLLSIWAARRGESMTGLLAQRWDGIRYTGIADHGYDSGAVPLSNLAFFPLFPLLIRAVTAVTWLSSPAASLVVGGVSALAGAWGLFRLGEALYGTRAGVILAATWGVLPHAVVESMAYTEGLLTALAAWTFWAVRGRRWLTAGLLCLVAGTVRPTAIALIVAVDLAAALACVRRGDGNRGQAWRPLAAIVLAPLGWLAYVGWVGLRVGRADGYFVIQRDQWRAGFDGGGWTVTYAVRALTRASAFDLYLVSLVLVVAISLFVLTIFDRQWWPLIVYSGLLLVSAVGTVGYFWARARYLVPAFPLLLPVAVGLAVIRTRTAVVVLTTLALFSGYAGGYLLLVWNHSP